MPSFLMKLGATIALSYALLDRAQVAQLAQMFGYGLGRSVGMLRNYRQNAEKLVKASPDGQKGMMSSMRDLDMVAREIRMAVWMARPGALMRMGPMGTMGMTLTPPPGQAQHQANPTGAALGKVLQEPSSVSPTSDDSSIQSSVVQPVHRSYDSEAMHEGGSDLLVSNWRSGVERTRVLKRG